LRPIEQHLQRNDRRRGLLHELPQHLRLPLQDLHDIARAAAAGAIAVAVVDNIPNWQKAVPTTAQLSLYTHAIISFAASTDWVQDASHPAGGYNKCRDTCDITASGFDNGNFGNLRESVQHIKSAGVKALLSFGGAGEGEYMAGATTCWEQCKTQVPKMVSMLTHLARDNELDGIDIDYEYWLNSTDTSTSDLLVNLTQGLRRALPPGALITHSPRQAPMDESYEDGGQYTNVLREIAADIDFLNIQMYNGLRTQCRTRSQEASMS
jgi:chitinase